MKARYESKTVEQALAHLAEELAEAGQAVAKSLRWGLDSVNPELPREEQETNAAWIAREMADVEEAYSAYIKLAAKQQDVALPVEEGR